MSVCVCVCVLVSAPRVLIASGMIWTTHDWSNKFHGFYMAAVVDIDSGREVSFYMRRGNQLNKSKLALYKPLLHCN